jgi:hypothetical protein
MGYPPSAGCWSPWRIFPGGLPHEIPKAKCQLIDAFRDPLLSPIFACGPTSYSVLTNHLPGREWALPVFAGASPTGTGWYAPGPPPLLASVLVRRQREMSDGSDFRRTGRFNGQRTRSCFRGGSRSECNRTAGSRTAGTRLPGPCRPAWKWRNYAVPGNPAWRAP